MPTTLVETDAEAVLLTLIVLERELLLVMLGDRDVVLEELVEDEPPETLLGDTLIVAN